MFYKISSIDDKVECNKIVNMLIDFIKSKGYDIKLEDLIIKNINKVDPISGSPMSAYTLQNQLPTNGVPHAGDRHPYTDDNNRTHYGILSDVGLI